MHLRSITTLFLMATLGASLCERTSRAEHEFSQNKFESPLHYFTTAKKVEIEVVYEQGAEPYVGETRFAQYKIPQWQILEDNLKALYQGRTLQPNIIVPKNIEGMREISKQNKTEWDDKAIYELSEKLRINHSNANEAHFLVIFLNGYYSLDDVNRPKTLGLSLNGTSVIAIFKQVIESSTDLNGTTTDKFLEQSTLVHEMGHALGLLNIGSSGLPMVHPHHDQQNSIHCSNKSCVMNWENSVNQRIVNFYNHLLETGDVVMYDSECLNDARSFRSE